MAHLPHGSIPVLLLEDNKPTKPSDTDEDLGRHKDGQTSGKLAVPDRSIGRNARYIFYFGHIVEIR